MPGLDGTGPRGMGPMTGGARGWCNPAGPMNAGYGYPYGFGRQGMMPGHGMGMAWGRERVRMGCGRGMGWGRGGGFGMGRGGFGRW